jgi:hypothetical protein
VCLYTWRLDPVLRERRRAEIDADLWECQHDRAAHRGLGPAIEVIARLLIGVPDDLGWRADHAAAQDSPPRRVAALTAVMAALFVVVFWVFAATRHVEMPTPPANPIAGWNPALMKRLPPPPPPPPPPAPPCAPPALTFGCR